MTDQPTDRPTNPPNQSIDRDNTELWRRKLNPEPEIPDTAPDHYLHNWERDQRANRRAHRILQILGWLIAAFAYGCYYIGFRLWEVNEIPLAVISAICGTTLVYGAAWVLTVEAYNHAAFEGE